MNNNVFFKYKLNPKTNIIISNSYFPKGFIGFDNEGEMILSENTYYEGDFTYKPNKINGVYNYRCFKIPLFNDYLWVGMDIYYQPFYEKTTEYLIDNRNRFQQIYGEFLNHSLENSNLKLNIYDKAFAEANDIDVYNFEQENYEEYISNNLNKIFEMPIGLDSNYKPVLIELNTGCFIKEYKSGFPVWTEHTQKICDKNHIPIYDIDYSVFNAFNNYTNSFLFSNKLFIKQENTKRKNKENQENIISSLDNNFEKKQSKFSFINPMLKECFCFNDLNENFENKFSFIDVKNNKWLNNFSKSIVGTSHIENGIVCQDSSIYFGSNDFQILIVSDGAGSAKFSDKGSKTLVKGLKRFVVSSFNAIYAPIVNGYEYDDNHINVAKIATIKHAIGLINDLAEDESRNVDDFLATLIIAIVGKENTFWIKVGDGALVVQYSYVENNDKDGTIKYTLKSLNDKSKSKGDLANETHFISPNLSQNFVQYGVFDNDYVTGIALMSDGLSERFVSKDDCFISTKLNDLILNPSLLKDTLNSQEFQKNEMIDNETGEIKLVAGYNGDDCSLVSIYREPSNSNFIEHFLESEKM